MRKLTSGFMVMLAIMTLMTLTVRAEFAGKYDDLANVLKEAGFFQGSDDGFELDRQPTRVEGAVMLVRMLGKEELVSQESFPHPFEDVPLWADDYVGYLYENGMTKGVSQREFGSQDLITGPQYFTFVLRALGYDDKTGDFLWSQSLEKALDLGIINEVEYTDLRAQTFLRDHAVMATFHGLRANVKDQERPLITALTEKGDVTEASERLILNGEYTMVGTLAEEVSVEEVLTKATRAVENIKSASIRESLQVSAKVMDETLSSEVLHMGVELSALYKTDYERRISTSVTDMDLNLYGIGVKSYEEAYADSDHHYIYTGPSSFLGFPTEASFDDVYLDPDYEKKYAAMFTKIYDYTTTGELDAIKQTGFKSADFEGLSIRSTDTAYIINGTEGFEDIIQGSHEMIDGQVSASTIKLMVDKDTGLLIHLFFDFTMTDENGQDLQGVFQLDIENIDQTEVVVPEKVQEYLDAREEGL